MEEENKPKRGRPLGVKNKTHKHSIMFARRVSKEEFNALYTLLEELRKNKG